MTVSAKSLSALAVAKVGPGLHFVGGCPGLALQVGVNGKARSWVLRVVLDGKRRTAGLGSYPEIGLARARELGLAKREKVRVGIDPVAEKRAEKIAKAKSTTFAVAATRYIAAHRAGWRNDKHVQQWENTLKTYAGPIIGEMNVADIEARHVIQILEPIWSSKHETARRVRGRVESVLDWAAVHGYRPKGPNPAAWKSNLQYALADPKRLPAAKVEHHAALPIDAMPAFWDRLRAAKGMGVRALMFAILTAARSGEVRGATWGEIDLGGSVWSIPAERMKMDRPHRVPLSAAAVDLLNGLPRRPEDERTDADLVFPSPQTGRELSDMTLGAVFKRMKVDATPHGTARSTFRDWVSERTEFPRELAEMALAHEIENKSEAAYRRGDMLERRAAMMAEWAAFIGSAEVTK